VALRSDRRPVALVTGLNGFTGRYVADALEAKGYRVEGLAVQRADGVSAQVDLLDREAVAEAVKEIRPAAVVHLAAISFVAHGDVEAIYRVNVLGTRNLLEALAGSPELPRIVVLASSANVYGNTTADPIDESTPPEPANDYAVSKLAMEYMARLWMDRLPIVIARPFNYTGIGQAPQFLVPKIVQHFRRREQTIELGNIRVWRDFSDVRDVANAYSAIVASSAAGRVFNLCSGVPHSIEEILDAMADIAGYRIEVRVNPAFVRGHEVERLVGDGRQLLELLGDTVRIPLHETLRWMYSEE
jgi:GDP-6-deoxy-D-talose 4-dehydrogenase